MNKGPWARWKTWIALDNERPAQGTSREARLDEMLRSGASDQVGESDGRMRWRVLGAISETKESPRAGGSMAGAIGWRYGALAACAVIVLGFGAMWLAPVTPPSSVPGAESASTQHERPTPGGARFPTMALLQNPMSTLAAQLDQPLERQTERLMNDARKLAGFFAERVTAPIAALHRAGTPAAAPEPSMDDLHSGGA